MRKLLILILLLVSCSTYPRYYVKSKQQVENGCIYCIQDLKDEDKVFKVLEFCDLYDAGDTL